MNQKAWNLKPDDIEARSMAIIDAEAGAHEWPSREWAIVRRMIHTTADFEWAKITRFHGEAIDSGLKALSQGSTIFTDTQMARMGVSPWRIGKLESQALCLMNDEAAIARAAKNDTTRAVAAMDLAVDMNPDAVYVIGNAPTALLRLLEHCQSGKAKPQLVVGLPVGFVNAAEAKEALSQTNLPYITAQGRKGGSAVAASVINALAILALEKQQ